MEGTGSRAGHTYTYTHIPGQQTSNRATLWQQQQTEPERSFAAVSASRDKHAIAGTPPPKRKRAYHSPTPAGVPSLLLPSFVHRTTATNKRHKEAVEIAATPANDATGAVRTAHTNQKRLYAKNYASGYQYIIGRPTWRWTSGGALHMSGTMLALIVSLSGSARQFSFPSPSSCCRRSFAEDGRNAHAFWCRAAQPEARTRKRQHHIASRSCWRPPPKPTMPDIILYELWVFS